MTVIRHEAVVPLSAAGRRFDQTLAEMFPDYSRSRLTAWVKAGSVTLDGAPAAPRYLLRGGEKVRVEAELEVEVASAPEDIALDIVHEDEHLLVMNNATASLQVGDSVRAVFVSAIAAQVSRDGADVI